jgi:ribonuclease HII
MKWKKQGRKQVTEEINMLEYENKLKEEGIYIVGGIDEAGRGPLAGPVVAACVVFDTRNPLPEARDSKKLTEKKREELFDKIIESCLAYGIGVVDNDVIDEINILNATYLAMQKAVLDLNEKNPEVVLVDHVHIPDMNIKQISITHGDASSLCIAASSIIAKVTRDRIMRELDSLYPGYGFARHKGYGTKAHYEAIETLGISKVHRKTFLKKYITTS